MSRLQLEPGDVVVLVSDGVTDRRDDQWLRAALSAFNGESPKDLARTLVSPARGDRRRRPHRPGGAGGPPPGVTGDAPAPNRPPKSLLDFSAAVSLSLGGAAIFVGLLLPQGGEGLPLRLPFLRGEVPLHGGRFVLLEHFEEVPGVSSGFLWRKMAMTVGNSTIAMSPPE
ncbi:MAG: SpoIIE family protein phosphatase [Intestinimonas sp.]